MKKVNRKQSSVSTKSNGKSTSVKSLCIIPDVKDTFEVLPSPTKSPSDSKEYKVIRLKNGLTACLISNMPKSVQPVQQKDADQEKLAAAALCINVGSYSNPKDIPGLAHFLEHMVFMGSEKYPEENDFDAFVKNHGGFDNAATGSETTTFYFEILESHFYRAMDKLAQFFISPLMKRESMTRERESVESEFQTTVMSDDIRISQLFKSLAKESSPVNSFMWGNLITLRDNISDDELYEKLHEFRKRHYSAHRMALAVQVVNCFSAVPNNKLPPDDFQSAGDIFDPLKLNRLYYVKPVDDTCEINLTWVMPSLEHMYRSKPDDYVSQLIVNKGKRSLYSYLRKKVWALTFFIGRREFNLIYKSFSINMSFTKEGLAHLKEVIGAIFCYLQILRTVGPTEWFFKQIQNIEDVSFRFQTEESAIDKVEGFVRYMHYYPPEDYLTGSDLYFEYNPEAIKMILDHLVPENMNIMLLSSNVPDTIKYDKTEPWFKTQYTDMDIPPEWLDSWKTPEPIPDLSYPLPNPFLTEDFSLLPEEDKIPDYPQKILDTPLIELWYKKDQKFKLPKGYYRYYLVSSLYNMESIRNELLFQMLAIFINMNLAEESYPAYIAGLDYDIVPCEGGISISVTGYNEKLPVLIEMIVKYIKNISTNLTKEFFEAIKEKMVKSVYNSILDPSLLCKDLYTYILQERFTLLEDCQDAILEITFEMMQNFSENALKHIYIHALIQGNVSKEVALETTKKMLKELNCEPITSEQYPKVKVNELPSGEHCVRVMSGNKNDTNSIIFNYYQYGPLNIKEIVILDFIFLLINEPLFDILRTKEQLGYNVSGETNNKEDVLNYTVTVKAQVDKHTVEHVDTRIETFLKHTQTILKKLTNKKFNQTKMNLIKIKQVVDDDLGDEVYRNWGEISNRKYMFDRYLREIKAVEEIKIGEVKKWWAERMQNNNNVFKKLTVQVVGHNTAEKLNTDNRTKTEETTEDKTDTEIDVKTETLAYPKLKLEFVEDKEEILRHNRKEDYFITDIHEFKKKLNTYPTKEKV